LRLLIVDANADACDSLALLVQLWGYDVRVVHTGPNGLELARAYRPDVVIAGLHLPGLDGYQLAERLREELSGITLIALTGDGQPEDCARARKAGFIYHLLKPAEPGELQGILLEEAKRKQAAPPS
jgi:two-component system CheB/CheR fusion protein